MEVQLTLSVQEGLLLSSVFDTRVLFPPGEVAGVLFCENAISYLKSHAFAKMAVPPCHMPGSIESRHCHGSGGQESLMELRVRLVPSEPLGGGGDLLGPLSGAGLPSVFLRAWLVGAEHHSYFRLYVACTL